MTDLVGTTHPGLTLLLRSAEERIRAELRPALQREHLSAEQWCVVSLLHAEPGLPMARIAERAVLPNATLTRLMDRLVADGIAVRRVDPSDRRRVVAALSARGADLAERLAEAERTVEERIARTLGADRFGALVDELTLLPHALP
jgi:DNA-binding MarR family transcriptional regulator